MLNFKFSQEHKMIEDSVKKFAKDKVKPLAEDFDQATEFMTKEFLEIYKQEAELGYFDIIIPEQYGGIGDGFDLLSCSIIHKELAKASAGIALSYLPTVIVAGAIIAKFGSEKQKEKYLPGSADGSIIPCLCVTEPNAGSDVSGIQSEFYKDGDAYVLNGSKQFITNAPVSNLFYTLAKDRDTGKPCAFLIEPCEGLTIGSHLNKTGHRASPTSEVFYDNCRIPLDSIVGEEGSGVEKSLMGIEMERIFCGSINLGIAEASLEESIKYAKERIAFGKPIANFQLVQLMIANMSVGVETIRNMLYFAITDCIENKDKPKKFPSLSTSILKYYSGITVQQVASDGVQIHGGYGYIKEYPVERYLRDSKLLQIGGGTSQIQAMMIAKNLLS